MAQSQIFCRFTVSVVKKLFFSVSLASGKGQEFQSAAAGCSWQVRYVFQSNDKTNSHVLPTNTEREKWWNKKMLTTCKYEPDIREKMDSQAQKKKQDRTLLPARNAPLNHVYRQPYCLSVRFSYNPSFLAETVFFSPDKSTGRLVFSAKRTGQRDIPRKP